MSAQSPFPIPRYHDDLIDLFERTEPELWNWFASQLTPDPEAAERSELELLKSAYRMEPGDPNSLDADASLLAGTLGIDAPVTCYQGLDADESNAEVRILDAPDGGHTVHIVFSGPLLAKLDPGETRAVLAHELAHVSLLLGSSGRYRALTGLVDRLTELAPTNTTLMETARRLRLHTEVYADAVSAHATGEPDDLITALVKTRSGITKVDAGAYRRQAEQILAAEDGPSTAWSHPELHVRVACLTAMQSTNGPELVAELIEGPDDLDRLDLLAAERTRTLTRSILASGLEATGLLEGHRSYLRSYVDHPGVLELASRAKLTPSANSPSGAESGTEQALPDLRAMEPSIRQLAAALLVDLALTVDDTDDIAHTATVALSRQAGRTGIDTEFDRLLSRATGLPLAQTRKLRA